MLVHVVLYFDGLTLSESIQIRDVHISQLPKGSFSILVLSSVLFELAPEKCLGDTVMCLAGISRGPISFEYAVGC